MKYLNVAKDSAAFFRAQSDYLGKLEAFLLTLISFNGPTKTKLEGLKEVGETVELSGHSDFTVVGELRVSHEGSRAYTIVFKDKDGAIEVGIALNTTTDAKKTYFTFFALQMLRFKYGRTGAVVFRNANRELPLCSALDKNKLPDAVTEFISATTGLIPFK